MKRMFTSDSESDHINALIYGEAGTGKTRSAITLPGKTVIISAESGLKTLRGYEIEVWKVESWVDFDTAINTLIEGKGTEEYAYDNVFVDSLTEVTKICGDYILNERKDIYAARKTNTKTMFHDQRSIEDWGVIKGRMDRMCRAFRDLPYNVFFTALKHDIKEEKTGITKSVPLVSPGSLAEDLPGIFDHVILAKADMDPSTKKPVFWWEHAQTEKQMGKDRSNNLEWKTEPNWQLIFDAYKLKVTPKEKK